jgi:hypothetical protein
MPFGTFAGFRSGHSSDQGKAVCFPDRVTGAVVTGDGQNGAVLYLRRNGRANSQVVGEADLS